MNKYSIGYRMKFDNIKSKDIKEVIKNYLKIFSRYEIKITDKIIDSCKMEILLDVSEELASGNYSLHLLKNILTSKKEYKKTKKLIQLLKKHNTHKEVYLVTHIPFDEMTKYIEVILDISSYLPNNYILLLENVEICSNNYEYLEQINKVFCVLNEKNVQNVGMCLDIGHLLFGFYQEGIIQQQGIAYIEKMNDMILRTKEVHIHDYKQKDHLQLGEGLMELEIVSKFLLKHNLDVPIIIETTVKKPKKDGIEQVKKLEEFLKAT